ncbi:MAG: RNA polymerase sigma factor [Candidatus Promineifilaceae bacterium]
MKYWLGFVKGRTEQDYCHEVIQIFLEFGDYVDSVRNHDDDTWAELDPQLRSWAYKTMLQRGFPANSNTKDLADNYAVEAIEDILQTDFTFDTSYMAWLRTIVQRKCNQGARRSQTIKRGRDVIQIRLDDLVETLEQGQNNDPATQVENHLDLMQARTRLTVARNKVLYLHYERGLSFQEIAEQMDRKISAIYSLHFKALEQLARELK